MISPIRKKALRRTTLEILQMAGGYAVIEETLRKHVGDLERPQPSDEEWADTVKFLSEGKFIAKVPSPMDHELVQWVLTERGQTLLTSLE